MLALIPPALFHDEYLVTKSERWAALSFAPVRRDSLVRRDKVNGERNGENADDEKESSQQDGSG